MGAQDRKGWAGIMVEQSEEGSQLSDISRSRCLSDGLDITLKEMMTLSIDLMTYMCRNFTLRL